MNRETIEKAAVEYVKQRQAESMSDKEVFIAGVEWLADYLCKIPFEEIIDELHEYCANKLKENSYDKGKCI